MNHSRIPPSVLRCLATAALIAGCFSASQRISIGAEVAASTRYEILDGGYRRFFELASDELYFPSEGRTVQAASANVATNEMLTLRPASPAAVPPQLVLYEIGREHSVASRRILTQTVVVKLREGTNPELIAKAMATATPAEQTFAPGYFIFQAAGPRGALVMAEALRLRPDVLEAEPMLGRQVARKAFVNDPYAFAQWHLLNRGLKDAVAGIDLRLTNVWETYRGRDVIIAIVDDGVQTNHPDLSPNLLTALGYDYRDGDNDPRPGGNDDYHGTPVAGVAAARGNNAIGVAGVAFEATLIPVRLIGGFKETDQQDAAAILHSNQIVHVSNNSWGAVDDGLTLDGPGVLMEQALATATRDGRGGRGTIFVFPAGNGATNFTTHATDNANFDGFANSIYAICVGAVDDQGKISWYSEPGSCVLICGLSDNSELGRPLITTTDLDMPGAEGINAGSGDLPDRAYTDRFNGTSAATPMVAGVAALMLQANPLLGWRDVQEILIRSATKVQPTDTGWITNSAGLRFNHKFGAGLVNAEAAVQLARTWTNLAAPSHIFLEVTNLSLSIPDGNTNGITRLFDFSTNPPMRIEHVTVTLTATHSRRGDLVMTMTSPGGTASRLAEKRLNDSESDFSGWKFMSVFDWGELSSGNWQVQISDQRGGGFFGLGGTLRGLRVDLYGTLIDTSARPSLAVEGYSPGQFRLRLNGMTNQTYDLQASSNLLNWLTIARTNLASRTSVQLIDNQATPFTARFYRALRATPSP